MSTLGKIVNGIRSVRDKKRLEKKNREYCKSLAEREYQELLYKTRKEFWSSIEGENEMWGANKNSTYIYPRKKINVFGPGASEEQEVQSEIQKAEPVEQYVQPANQVVKPAEHNVQPANQVVKPAEHNVQPANQVVKPEEQYVQPANQAVKPVKQSVKTVGQYPQSTIGKGKYQSIFPKYEPPANINLTVILLENSDAVFTEKDTVKKIIETSVKGGKFCIIDYSSKINWNDLKDDTDFTGADFFTVGFEKAVNLYDAILYLGAIIEENLNRRTSYHNKTAIIKSIEVVGIGTGCDTNSYDILTKEGIKTWKDILKKCKNTKYYCIDEYMVVRVAALGFRSIGVIHRVF